MSSRPLFIAVAGRVVSPCIVGDKAMNGFELGTDGPQVILVGLDGSVTSLRAAAYAGGLARRQSAKLVAVYVRSASSMAAFAPLGAASIQQAHDEASAELRQRVIEGAENIGLAVEFVTAEGEPFAELVRVANEIRADAVVVGASTQAGHRVVGSIAVRLVRAGRWPVIVVP
jgi:nucleotide-binding universal stress UspA family protein